MPWEHLRNDIHSEPKRKEDYTNCFPRLTAKAKIKIRKAEIFFSWKGASLALGGVEHLIFIFSPQGDALWAVRGITEHQQFSHHLTSAPAGPMFVEGTGGLGGGISGAEDG